MDNESLPPGSEARQDTSPQAIPGVESVPSPAEISLSVAAAETLSPLAGSDSAPAAEITLPPPPPDAPDFPPPAPPPAIQPPAPPSETPPPPPETPPPAPARLSPAEADELRSWLLGNGAVAAVLEALEDAAFIFTASGQLLHANAEALKTVDLVGVSGAVGLRLNEMFGCAAERVTAAGCDTPIACHNCLPTRQIIAALDGTPVDGTVSLLLEQSAQFYTGKFHVRASALRIDGLDLRLLILRQKSLQKRVLRG